MRGRADEDVSEIGGNDVVFPCFTAERIVVMERMIIPENNEKLGQDMNPIVVNENPVPIDILDRQEMVDQILDLLKTLSERRSSCSFALDGPWGSGKTFILNMLEQQLREYQAGEKFIVFHYNCWQYDYYDEPLIAIVSAMLDNIDEYVHLFPQEVREIAGHGLVVAKQVLKKVALSFLENKIGVDFSDLPEIVEKIQDETSAAFEEEHGYDNYYAFHKKMEQAREELSKIAENQTLVIVVDELDRCLPDYAIKTLERLHHLFAGLSNTIVFMALDKEQLENTIRQIFGESVNCAAYLKKFVDFELEIDTGVVNSNFFEKFRDYIALFDESALEPWVDLYDFIAALFSQIDIRRQEHLVKKIQMIHQLLFSGQPKKDFSFLCFELLMAVLSDNAAIVDTAPLHFVDVKRSPYDGYVLKIEHSIPVPLATYIKEHWNYQIGLCQAFSEHYPIYNGTFDIPLLIIGYSELTYGEKGILSHHSEYSKYAKYIDGFKAVKQMLDIIK